MLDDLLSFYQPFEIYVFFPLHYSPVFHSRSLSTLGLVISALADQVMMIFIILFCIPIFGAIPFEKIKMNIYPLELLTVSAVIKRPLIIIKKNNYFK